MRFPAKLIQHLLRFVVLLPLVAFICVFTFVATSHAATVRVTGRITDQNGSGILNVQISAKDPSTGAVDFGPVSTLADGSYELDVSPGTYNILIQPPSSSNIASLVESNYLVTTDQ